MAVAALVAGGQMSRAQAQASQTLAGDPEIITRSHQTASGSALSDSTEGANKPSPLTMEQAKDRLHEGKPVYSCPMKTDWFSDQPGQCPSCTDGLMKVKTIKDGEAVFEEGSMNMDMKSMPMNDTTMETKR